MILDGSPRTLPTGADKAGGTAVKFYELRDNLNRTRVAVLMDVADMDAVMAAMETPGAREAMAHDGVLLETLVILVEE